MASDTTPAARRRRRIDSRAALRSLMVTLLAVMLTLGAAGALVTGTGRGVGEEVSAAATAPPAGTLYYAAGAVLLAAALAYGIARYLGRRRITLLGTATGRS
ncbi:hypothetical protein [Streptomyces spiramenti]|uniref:Uncharacterized protein n=1 Tax=Streptomyces spiramenti TaxID=2720606 RepID=A0ABX1AFS3_9ACTN|nr:hypothetical protein [Streptomyces spiramenti]NJP66037.1 hypothetical protein [Streptomyces spiramenti]